MSTERRHPLPAIPYEVALVVAGALLGFLPFRIHAVPPPGVVLLIFIPPLLFEGAWTFETRELPATWKAIAALALAGTFATAALAATGVRGLWGVGWETALLFGAIVSATDPIAVLAIFRRIGAPRALAAIMEGESLVNDGIAVVLFRVFLAGAVGGDALGAGGAVASFCLVTLGGIACGLVAGLSATAVVRLLRRPWIEIVVTLAVAYASYVAAERFHVSGIFAVLAAALLLNDRERRGASRAAVARFWGGVAIAANAVLWIIVGLQIDLRLVAAQWVPAMLAVVAVYLARGVAVFAILPALPRKERPPRRWRVVLVWGGLRGAIAMALALSLPNGLPNRDLLIAATAGVVFVTIVLSGTTMRPLLGRLQLASPRPG